MDLFRRASDVIDSTVDLGQCHVCGKIMPFEGNFQKTSINKGWGKAWGGEPRFYKNTCRRCYCDFKKKERDENKERFLELEKNRYHRRREALLARGAEYRKKNRAALAAKSIQRRKNNREYYRTYQREYLKSWRLKNPTKGRTCTLERRARIKKSVVIGSVNQLQIDDLYRKQQGRCAACYLELFDKYHMDHIIPLAKNGTHEIFNIQLLHQRCNLFKGSKDPIEFMQSLGFLL